MPAKLAIDGGTPVRRTPLPYGRQWVDEGDTAAVIEALHSAWLTTGPAVENFEAAVARACDARQGIAVSSGTAALHAAMAALDLDPGDEVIVSPMTFAASANCILFVGASPVFADVDPDTLLIDPAMVERRVTPRTRAIIAVDYAGHPCDYDALRGIAERHGLVVIADAAHSLGGSYSGRRVGSVADLTTFSFHPVKHITTGEGGMIVTDRADLADRMRIFRNHGIDTDHRDRAARGAFFYEMVELGYNYRITDIQCALGLSQLRRLDSWVQRRREIAMMYDAAIAPVRGVQPLVVRAYAAHAYHLYVVQLLKGEFTTGRDRLFSALRAEGIGVNVHYIPVHLHPYYQKHVGTRAGLCPIAERAYQQIISIPMFPGMSDADVRDVCEALEKVVDRYGRR